MESSNFYFFLFHLICKLFCACLLQTTLQILFLWTFVTTRSNSYSTPNLNLIQSVTNSAQVFRSNRRKYHNYYYSETCIVIRNPFFIRFFFIYIKHRRFSTVNHKSTRLKKQPTSFCFSISIFSTICVSSTNDLSIFIFITIC